MRDWRDALDWAWAHAIGQDDNGALIWRTGLFDDWRQLMRELAEIKIGLRTYFAFHTGKGAPNPEARHWLSYPVTNHSVKPWGNNARLPNTLRFKVRRDKHGKPYGVIFHMPCQPPASFGPSKGTLIGIWRQVHQFLDGHGALRRSPW